MNCRFNKSLLDFIKILFYKKLISKYKKAILYAINYEILLFKIKANYCEIERYLYEKRLIERLYGRE